MPQLETIVAGVDFLAPSHDALTWVAHHWAPDARYVVVHALELPKPPSFLGETTDQQSITEEIRKAILADTAELEARSPGVQFYEAVPFGSASAELARIAQSEEADLIVVGPHGDGGGIKGMLGSTAERILACSTVPVLLVAGRFSGPPARILVAIDDSGVRDRVMAWAAFLAGRFRASVTAFHCLDLRLFGRMRLVSGTDRMARLEEEALEDTDAWIRGELTKVGLPPEGECARATIGSPGLEISKLACEDYDLLILGSRGEGTTQRLFLGSVAKRVIRTTCIPVLMVPHG